MRYVRSFLGLIVVIAACGGSVTTVDNNKKTSTLSAQDQTSLCQDTFNYARSNISPSDAAKMACGFKAANDPNCMQTYNQCIASFPTTSWSTATPDCSNFNQFIANCDVTVGQYADCFKQEIDAIKSLASRFPVCDKAQLLQIEIDASRGISTQCIAALSKCKFVVSTGSSSSSGPTQPPTASDGGTVGPVLDAGPPGH